MTHSNIFQPMTTTGYRSATATLPLGYAWLYPRNIPLRRGSIGAGKGQSRGKEGYSTRYQGVFKGLERVQQQIACIDSVVY